MASGYGFLWANCVPFGRGAVQLSERFKPGFAPLLHPVWCAAPFHVNKAAFAAIGQPSAQPKERAIGAQGFASASPRRPTFKMPRTWPAPGHAPKRLARFDEGAARLFRLGMGQGPGPPAPNEGFSGLRFRVASPTNNQNAASWPAPEHAPKRLRGCSIRRGHSAAFPPGDGPRPGPSGAE
jgi:hypothetical protein